MGRKKGSKYERIIEAAVDVIAKYGFHQAKVANIAKAAGVADGTIYLYFKSKEDILVSIFEEKMGEIINKIRKKIALTASPLDKLFMLIEVHLKQLAERESLAIVTQVELRQADPQLRKKINEIYEDYLFLIEEILREGKEKGHFSNDLDITLARQIVFGTLNEIITNWVMEDRPNDLVSLAKPVHKLFINTFCCNK